MEREAIAPMPVCVTLLNAGRKTYSAESAVRHIIKGI
jgi:hypothetical protein